MSWNGRIIMHDMRASFRFLALFSGFCLPSVVFGLTYLVPLEVSSISGYFKTNLGLTTDDSSSLTLSIPDLALESEVYRHEPTADDVQNAILGDTLETKVTFDGWTATLTLANHTFTASATRTSSALYEVVAGDGGKVLAVAQTYLTIEAIFPGDQIPYGAGPNTGPENMKFKLMYTGDWEHTLDPVSSSLLPGSFEAPLFFSAHHATASLHSAVVDFAVGDLNSGIMQVVPEAHSLAMFGFGGVVIFMVVRRRVA